MNDNPLDRLPAFDRVSIRAVLVHEGEDPSAALAEAGIFDPVAIPVMVGDEHDPSGGILGDGITPNLIGMLETEREDDFGTSPHNPSDKPGSRPDAAQQDEAMTTMLPAAFGLRPFAPVRRVGVTGKSPDRTAGRYGSGARSDPPTPTLFSKGLQPGASGRSPLSVSVPNSPHWRAGRSRLKDSTTQVRDPIQAEPLPPLPAPPTPVPETMNDSGLGRSQLLRFKQPGFVPGTNDWPVYWPDMDPLNRLDTYMDKGDPIPEPLPERPFRDTSVKPSPDSANGDGP